VLGEDRQLIIHLPQGYERGQQQYPVMYLLDGDAHFHHTTGITQFLTRGGYMPANRKMSSGGIPALARNSKSH